MTRFEIKSAQVTVDLPSASENTANIIIRDPSGNVLVNWVITPTSSVGNINKTREYWGEVVG